MNFPRILGFIPARGGSKGVTNKNLRLLGGIPLALRSINYAINEPVIADVLFSTDALELAKLVMPSDEFEAMTLGSIRRLGPKLLVHRRPPEQASDFAKISETLFHISRDALTLSYENIVMLQPTAPFRFEGEIETIHRISLEKEWTSIVSIRNAASSHPERMYRIRSTHLEQYAPTKIGDNPPRQLLEPVYIKDGAFYYFKSKNLQLNVMLGDKVLPYERSNLPSANIDTEDDFQFAEFLESRLKEKN